VGLIVWRPPEGTPSGLRGFKTKYKIGLLRAPPAQVAWATRPGEALPWAVLFQAFGLMGSSVDGGPLVQAEGLRQQSLGQRPRWRGWGKGREPCKGETIGRSCSALSGLGDKNGLWFFRFRRPRALPWAVLFQAFGLNGGAAFKRGGRNLRK